MLSHEKDMVIYNLPGYTQGIRPPVQVVPVQPSSIVKNSLPNSRFIPDLAPYSEQRPYIGIYNTRKVIIYKGINLSPLNNVIAPKILPVVCGSTDLQCLNSGLDLTFTDNTSRNHLILGMMDRQWKKCTVSVVDLDSDGNPAVTTGDEIKVKTTKLGLLGNISLSMAELCSMRGRVFAITDTTAPQLHVLDYVLPSE